jgi:hypothetical protein
MSDDWKKPLWENLHHLTVAFLFVCMLVYDFLPLMVMIGLMKASEWLLHEKAYSLFGTPLETIINHIEVALLISFMGLGGIKILVRLGLSILDLRNGVSR